MERCAHSRLKASGRARHYHVNLAHNGPHHCRYPFSARTNHTSSRKAESTSTANGMLEVFARGPTVGYMMFARFHTMLAFSPAAREKRNDASSAARTASAVVQVIQCYLLQVETRYSLISSCENLNPLDEGIAC